MAGNSFRFRRLEIDPGHAVDRTAYVDDGLMLAVSRGIQSTMEGKLVATEGLGGGRLSSLRQPTMPKLRKPTPLRLRARDAWSLRPVLFLVKAWVHL